MATDHTAYMREWRRRRKAAGLPYQYRNHSPEAVARRRAQIAELTRLRRTVSPPHVVRAQKLVHSAVKSGRLVRPEQCEQCGASGPIEGAHSDYNRPLEVRWLCRSCHRRWDRAEPKAGNWAGSEE